LSYTKFDGSIEAHAILREAGLKADLTFPHSTGKSVTVAIASDEVLAQIEAGQIDFDILITTPDMMPKLAKHARVLGPRGLMPNPKNGTITDKPEAKKKEFEAGKISIKTEKKAPLIHLTIGKTSMETKDLVENIQALIKAFKGQMLKLSVSASMSPGVRVEVA
jgi:large subunit ribosomal protein L1